MKASITLFFLATLCATFAVRIPDGEQYFAQLYARFGTFQVGRAMHPYNIFTYKNASYQSGGVLAYSNFRSIVWKKEVLTQVNSSTSILEVSMQTLDGNDLFPDKIPLQRSAVADWIYASDMWFLIGFSGNNDSATDGISFQHDENSIISIESAQAKAYNNYTLIDITAIQSQLQQEPLGYIVYFPYAVGKGINRVVATFTISEHTLHPNDPVYPPPNRDPTLQSFCDTLNTNCENCNSHPSCVYCVFNESVGFRQMRSSCLLNNEDFTTRGCIQLGGTLQEVCKVLYTGNDTVTDSTTSLSPFSSTTSVQIECFGCEITKQLEDVPSNSKLSKGAVIAISLSVCVVVLLTVGILFVFVKRAALVKSNTVQMQEIAVEKQPAETAGN